MHRYASFINFQATMHSMVLEQKKDLAKQENNAGFIITDEDVDVII